MTYDNQKMNRRGFLGKMLKATVAIASMGSLTAIVNGCGGGGSETPTPTPTNTDYAKSVGEAANAFKDYLTNQGHELSGIIESVQSVYSAGQVDIIGQKLDRAASGTQDFAIPKPMITYESYYGPIDKGNVIAAINENLGEVGFLQVMYVSDSAWKGVKTKTQLEANFQTLIDIYNLQCEPAKKLE